MKVKISTLTPMLVLVALIVAGMVIPVGDTNDIYLTVMVEKPIVVIGDPPAKIIDINGYATPHTLLESPYLANLISSGPLKIGAEAGNIKSVKLVGTIFKGTSATYQITLRNVPRTQTNAIVTLYENNVITDTKNVVITEVK